MSLVVSIGLVAVIGGVGLLAGQRAGEQARDVHRADRLTLQQMLGGLTEKYALLSAGEMLDALGGMPETGAPAWSAAPGDADTVARLDALVAATDGLDAGAVLVGPLGERLGAYSADGAFPAADDPGWRPLRAAVLRRDGTLPVSDVMRQRDEPVQAMALPVRLSDGRVGLVIGLWYARTSGLQQYVAGLHTGSTRRGYVVDSVGNVIAGLDPRQIGEPLPFPGVRERLTERTSGVLDSTEGGEDYVTTFARAGSLGWTSLGVQPAADFEGALVKSSRLAQATLVLLLLAAGSGLVALHRKREAALRAVALRDELTGVYNRRGWFAVAEHELERARRCNGDRVLLFVDVDGLKQVNDTLGHREGDRAIMAAAAVLKAASRSSDLAGRLGGDEFVLLLSDDGDVDVARRRVLDALAEHNERSSAGFELQLSVGAEVWFPTSGWTLDELVRRADDGMYEVKKSRPSRHEGVIRLPQPRHEDDIEVVTTR
jgi:diguanylate cyclase (GGDEF)-like protein